jgi:hypothetical protein
MRFDEYEKLFPREANVIDEMTEFSKQNPEKGNWDVKRVWE